jgi:hypothetical protein
MPLKTMGQRGESFLSVRSAPPADHGPAPFALLRSEFRTPLGDWGGDGQRRQEGPRRVLSLAGVGGVAPGGSASASARAAKRTGARCSGESTSTSRTRARQRSRRARGDPPPGDSSRERGPTCGSSIRARASFKPCNRPNESSPAAVRVRLRVHAASRPALRAYVRACESESAYERACDHASIPIVREGQRRLGSEGFQTSGGTAVRHPCRNRSSL